MLVIKLNAIDSTNDFLKRLCVDQEVENFTYVRANEQLKGRGQLESKWCSEKGKNLTFSFLVKDVLLDASHVFTLNVAVALAVLALCKDAGVINGTIKWPNDILSGNKKVAGILIENSFKSNGSIVSIVGVGLNVNQTAFESLPGATSLKNILQTTFDLDFLLTRFSDILSGYMKCLTDDNHSVLWQKYHENLFKIGVPVAFESSEGFKFMGIINKITATGRLEVLHDDDTVRDYGVKEIKMLY